MDDLKWEINGTCQSKDSLRCILLLVVLWDSSWWGEGCVIEDVFIRIDRWHWSNQLSCLTTIIASINETEWSVSLHRFERRRRRRRRRNKQVVVFLKRCSSWTKEEPRAVVTSVFSHSRSRLMSMSKIDNFIADWFFPSLSSIFAECQQKWRTRNRWKTR